MLSIQLQSGFADPKILSHGLMKNADRVWGAKENEPAPCTADAEFIVLQLIAVKILEFSKRQPRHSREEAHIVLQWGKTPDGQSMAFLNDSYWADVWASSGRDESKTSRND